MWNKLLALLFFLPLVSMADTWLGYSRTDLLDEIKDNVQKIKIVTQSDTLICLQGEEEDERCRRFKVKYTFRLSEGQCTSYTLTTDSHEYWANRFLTYAEENDGESQGENLTVDGVEIAGKYVFEDHVLQLSQNKNVQTVEFRIAATE